MAAFSYQHQPLLLDSLYLQNINNNNNNFTVKPSSSSDFITETTNNFIHTPNNMGFSQFYPPNYYNFHGSSTTATPTQSDVENESSITKKHSPQSSIVVDCYNNNNNNNNDNTHKIESGDEQVTQIVTSAATTTTPLMARKRKNSAQSKDARQERSKRLKKIRGPEKEEEEVENNNENKEKSEKKITEFPTKDYIHVRARRGQATDSHSLAERVRREKISERMKALQKLVPGCDKVTGKALMLDEIINYVQSLQNQVEFLSMKLASVNPLFYDFGVDLFDNSFMIQPTERLLNTRPISSSLPQCSGTVQQQATNLGNTTTATLATTAAEIYSINVPAVDSTVASFHQGQRIQNSFPQDNGSLLWDVEDQKQKFHNTTSSGLIMTNNLCSFH